MCLLLLIVVLLRQAEPTCIATVAWKQLGVRVGWRCAVDCRRLQETEADIHSDAVTGSEACVSSRLLMLGPRVRTPFRRLCVRFSPH